jgi:hypothetical protein
MAKDSQRDKARAIFGKTFFENSKALPNPKNAAAALQKRANDRPIPTYKVGGAVKKNTPPGPTPAERAESKRFRDSIAKGKVTKEQADTIARGNRVSAIEAGRYKDGGKANQDFTGLMKKAASRAAAKGTPVMKDGGATNEYTAKRVMSRIKAGNFKDGGRAESMRDRRMKDIEKDYKIALAKGKNEGVAKAKYEQRKADAADDYAKRTKGDRTATSAAERAAEASLKEARRTKGESIKKRDMANDIGKFFAGKDMTPKAAAPAKAAEPAAVKPVVKKTVAKAPKRVVAPARAATPAAAPARTVTPAPARAATPAPAANNRTAFANIATPALIARTPFGEAAAAKLKREDAERTAQAARDKAAMENRYQGRGRIVVQAPRAVQAPKKVETKSTGKALTAEERKKRDAVYLSTIEGYAAGGAGKVRKGMTKGK